MKNDNELFKRIYENSKLNKTDEGIESIFQIIYQSKYKSDIEKAIKIMI